MKLTFSDNAWNDYQYWDKADKKVLKRLNHMIKEAKRTPFKGIGKPEPLKGDLSGWWSRRITSDDRMVYRVSAQNDGQVLEIIQIRFHYGRWAGVIERGRLSGGD